MSIWEWYTRGMLDQWEISTDEVHLVLLDNAANMAKVMQEALLPLLGCFAHSLQLVVEYGVLSQRVVTDVLATWRTIVGHFKHSSVAYGRLHSIQERLGVPQHCLQQDVCTRWNSSLYMVKYVIEQKMLLATYATETGIVRAQAPATIIQNLCLRQVRKVDCRVLSFPLQTCEFAVL